MLLGDSCLNKLDAATKELSNLVTLRPLVAVDMAQSVFTLPRWLKSHGNNP